jgi:hypothetical protein
MLVLFHPRPRGFQRSRTRRGSETIDEALSEVDQRVVASAHDENAVSGLCFRYKSIADPSPVSDVNRLPSTGLHLVSEPV